MMHIDHPFHVDGTGRTARAADDDHVRDLIEQVLFTTPGERINMPSFGSSLAGLVFAPSEEALTGAAQMMVQAALQQWLGTLIQVEEVLVDAQDALLKVTIRYVVRRSQTRQVAQFARQV